MCPTPTPEQISYGPLHIPAHTRPGFVLQKRQTVDTVSESLYRGVCGGAILQPVFPHASGVALLSAPWAEGLHFPETGACTPHCAVSDREDRMGLPR